MWAQANLIPEPLDATEPSWLMGHKRVPGTKQQGPQLPTLEERVESDGLGRYALLLTSAGSPAPPAPLQPPVALPPAHASNEHCDVPVACADQLAAWLSALEQWPSFGLARGNLTFCSSKSGPKVNPFCENQLTAGLLTSWFPLACFGE